MVTADIAVCSVDPSRDDLTSTLGSYMRVKLRGCSTAAVKCTSTNKKKTGICDNSACGIKKTAENGVLLNNLEFLAMQNGNNSNNVKDLEVNFPSVKDKIKFYEAKPKLGANIFTVEVYQVKKKL